jgi:hypothetical protein
MKVEFDSDEAWELMSLVVGRLLDDVALSAGDKAKVRRWRSDEMRSGSEMMRLLTEKINRDVAEAVARKKRSAIRRPDWR